ncbi:MAG: hypothetical protein PHF37_08340 [Phycisphaerae bacterium]|nr:hypothetical protein [Phycisphaerae bacterium]
MFDTIEKMMLAGLGAMSMTKERAEKIFDEYVSRGQVEKDKKAGFVHEMLDAAERTRTDLETIISKQVKETVKKLDLAAKEDIAKLEAKIDKLIKKS